MQAGKYFHFQHIRYSRDNHFSKKPFLVYSRNDKSRQYQHNPEFVYYSRAFLVGIRQCLYSQGPWTHPKINFKLIRKSFLPGKHTRRHHQY